MGGCTNQVKWLLTTISYGITLPSPYLAKYSLLTKWHLVSHYLIADPGQLIAERLGGYDLIGLGRFALIIAGKLSIMSSGKMRGLYKGPAQIPIAILAIPSGFWEKVLILDFHGKSL